MDKVEMYEIEYMIERPEIDKNGIVTKFKPAVYVVCIAAKNLFCRGFVILSREKKWDKYKGVQIAKNRAVKAFNLKGNIDPVAIYDNKLSKGARNIIKVIDLIDFPINFKGTYNVVLTENEKKVFCETYYKEAFTLLSEQLFVKE